MTRSAQNVKFSYSVSDAGQVACIFRVVVGAWADAAPDRSTATAVAQTRDHDGEWIMTFLLEWTVAFFARAALLLR